ncbi:hypothetical protein N9V92_03300 [Luminiphilus sp.]|nr:hypothetical protein [Luminiphilus sp.]
MTVELQGLGEMEGVCLSSQDYGYRCQGLPWQVARFLHDSVQPLQGIDSVGGMGFAIR